MLTVELLVLPTQELLQEVAGKEKGQEALPVELELPWHSTFSPSCCNMGHWARHFQNHHRLFSTNEGT
jgi:hypothetical protein